MEKTTALAAPVYGLGMMATGAVALALAYSAPGQKAAVPDFFHVASGVFLIAAGAAVLWRRTAAWGGAALAVYFVLIGIVVRNGSMLLAHIAQYLAYENLAILLALATGGLMVFAARAPIDAALATRLARIGIAVFGICAVIFGGAHFAYMDLTAPLIPKWLPPGQEFWAYATGIAQIAAGVAILANVQGRLAAILLTVMYAIFIPLVWGLVLMASPSSLGRWNEAAQTLALMGCAWLVADSLPRPALSARPHSQ